MLEYLIAFVHRLGLRIAYRYSFLVPKQQGGVHHLLLTIALICLALWARLAIAPINAGLQYVTFFPAVTLAAIAGGFEAGLLATLIGLAFATYIFTPPYYSFSIEALKTAFWSNMVFLLDGVIVSFSIETMHRYRQKCAEALIQSTQAHAALEESTQHLTKILDNLFAYVTLLDTDGVVQEVNKAALERAGCRREDVIGQHFYDDPWWSYDETIRSQLKDAINSAKQGHTLRYDVVVKMGDELVPIDFQISPVFDQDGKIVGLLPTGVDISLRKRAEEEIRVLAFYDSLTGLPNRRLLLDRFNLALLVSDRSKRFGAVLFLDLDKFKTLNDLLGHCHGDMLLIEVAERIKLNVREVDTVARFGGDEFVVLLEDLGDSVEDASKRSASIAEKIRAALAAPFCIKGHVHHSSPSIGVCIYRGHTVSADELISRADIAMYQAKNAGRNTVRFYDPVLQQTVETRAALESDLRRALSDRQLHLYYQIQYDNHHVPLAAEALIRWIHPKLGMLPPEQFIPLAEESALILEIGRWVIDNACWQLAAWKKNQPTRNLLLAINVSPHQFMMHNFVESVETAIRAHGIDPSCLKLELTESAILNDIASGMTKMKALKALGVSLSLDDFGTGYSSLSCLRQLPIDQIKIDQRFMRDIASDPNDGMMVKTIIDMAKNFSLNVIAEGVETEAQVAFLKKNGCLAFQGYLFGKPMPIEQFDALLKQDTLFDIAANAQLQFSAQTV